MGGEKRRENLLKILQESESAVSGTKLATKFQVPPVPVPQTLLPAWQLLILIPFRW